MDAQTAPLAPLVDTFDHLIDEVTAIDADLTAAVQFPPPQVADVHPDFRASALNLGQYLALRRRDIRKLQASLSDLGLSSLGRAEAHVQASVRAVSSLLHTLANRPAQPTSTTPPVALDEGDALLTRHTEALFGPTRRDRHVRIMVTASSDLTEDADLMRSMVEAGMDVLRINCAHDNEETWARMIANLRRAERDTGRTCRVIMDLAGPKLRTGPVEAGPSVLKWRPRRDSYGNVLAPARIWLSDGSAAPAPEADAMLTVPAEWLAKLGAGDTIRFVDTRGAKRRMTALAPGSGGWWADARQTSYVGTGTELQLGKDRGKAVRVDVAPASGNAILLHTGDTLVLTRSLELGRSAGVDAHGIATPARIGCTLPEVFDSARRGERIWFDDGKIGGVIRHVDHDEIQVEITRALAEGSRLRAEKGINLPDTDLHLSALTPKDLADLPFVAANADMIDYSFVSRASDVAALHRALDELGGRRPGIVLKIETRRAFEHLPEIILEAMREPTAGIMIARGDLAVEVGYERLAEVQEEILWIAEAAHIPVIWATQVLETLAQKGVPSRSEITDAAMGERAESVMLNKGPHIVDAIRVLDNILRRMGAHQRKKRSLLRELKAWAPRPAS